MTSSINYFQIPEERLGVLVDFGFKELHEIEREVKKDWIKKNRCVCVKELKQGKVLRCEHIKKEKLEKTKCIKDRLRKQCFVSQFRTLSKIKCG